MGEFMIFDSVVGISSQSLPPFSREVPNLGSCGLRIAAVLVTCRVSVHHLTQPSHEPALLGETGISNFSLILMERSAFLKEKST